MQLDIAIQHTLADIPLPLHAPDGFFSLPVAIGGYAVTAAVLAYAVYRTNRDLSERAVPMMGVMAAFIFAVQMLNFPVAGGTSGHLVGGALAAIVLGPWAAIIVMTAVVGLQALLFQDGGLLVLGVNLLVMSILSVLAGYAVYWIFRRAASFLRESWGMPVGGFIGAWTSVVVIAAVAALLLAASGTSPLELALPAMVSVHALIGIGEGLITVFALSFIRAARPQLLEDRAPAAPATGETSNRRLAWWVVGYLIALATVLIAPLASSSPDGLERVAEDQGFIETALDAPYNIIPDYVLPGVASETIATILAGFVGVTLMYLLVAGCGYLAYRAIKRRA